jgi:hypothetical protein
VPSLKKECACIDCAIQVRLLSLRRGLRG